MDTTGEEKKDVYVSKKKTKTEKYIYWYVKSNQFLTSFNPRPFIVYTVE